MSTDTCPLQRSTFETSPLFKRIIPTFVRKKLLIQTVRQAINLPLPNASKRKPLSLKLPLPGQKWILL